MSGSAEFWVEVIDVSLGVLVLVAFLAVAVAAVLDAVGRRQRPRFRFEDIPGVGILPVLTRDETANPAAGLTTR